MKKLTPYLISMFCFFCCCSVSIIYCVPPDYVGNNEFCDTTHTKDEIVDVFWSLAGAQTSYTYWQYVMMPSFRDVAQTVNNPTLQLPDFPFVDSNAVPWSDTWGVCAYFDCNSYTPMYGPDPVRNLADVNMWINLTAPLSDAQAWRVIGVVDINIPGVDCVGITPETGEKLSIVEKT